MPNGNLVFKLSGEHVKGAQKIAVRLAIFRYSAPFNTDIIVHLNSDSEGP